eukprot:CAMPEP_0194268386 /NCGR_PEP_ID=MMETSP0169-20130528/2730_1 /TAXON_ID=218684 /ORGANISM="Corethron pennatum, Strain L29A3" /LENGTH=277 /DNA_ID=CAMNT_0039009609 /DNA_START=113 /DNA_END=946 /DNA_ORIENTATION=-
MILSKVSIFFTTLAVATLSAKSAEVISSDVMVERDTRMLKKGKKGKKGGSASPVYIKSKKKGKQSISTASPTGLCEQDAFSFIANDINRTIGNNAYYRKAVENDANLSNSPPIFNILDTADSLINDVQSVFFGDDTGCDYNDSLELYDCNCTALPSGRNLQENTRHGGRELQSLLETILFLGDESMRGSLYSCVLYDNLNKLYPPAMGKLDQIVCGYYAASKDVVALVSAFTSGTYDFTERIEYYLEEALSGWGTNDFFLTTIGAAPTAFDNTTCIL